MPNRSHRDRDRGRLAAGMRADLVLFDAAKVNDEATFEEPHRHATGIEAGWVSGVALVERGRPTAARPSRAVRRT